MICIRPEISDSLFNRTGVRSTPVDLCRALKEIGFVQVKVHKRSVEASEDQCAEFERLCTTMGLLADHVISIDEVGTVS